MKISNFNTSELEEYYNNKEIIFFNFRKCYILSKEDNNFKFTEFKQGRKNNGLPHSKSGRFYAFKISDSYCKDYNFENI